MPFDVIENDAPLGTSNEKLPDFCHSEFPSNEFATVRLPTLALSENVFAQLSELPKLIFRGGGLPPHT